LTATEEPPGPAHHHLHWIDPPTAKNDQRQSDESIPKRFEDSADAALNKSTSLNSSPQIDAPRIAAGNRLPFVPSNSLCHALPPIDPQAPEIRGDYRGAKPAEAASFRLAPPNKITEISVPTFAGGQSNDDLRPPETLSNSNVTKIDPLAIGKSLDLTAPMAVHVASNKAKDTSADRSLARDRVEQAAFYGAPPPQRPAVQPNPLRNGAAAGEAISTDSPTGSVNPLR
jgi:hypothetical protein